MSDLQLNQISSGYANQAKKAEEDAFLEALKKKEEEKKLQLDRTKDKLQEQKLEQTEQIKKTDQENQREVKLLEQISKTVKTDFEKLNPEQLKQILPTLKNTEAELIQKILESHRLEEIQQKYKQTKLEDAGVKQKFSEAYKVLNEIAKTLKIPVEDITTEIISNYLKLNKNEKTFDPKKLMKQEKTDTSKVTNDKDAALKSNIENRYQQLKDLLMSLKNKQENILKTYQDNEGLQNQLETLDKQINKLENKLSDLNRQLNKLDEKNSYKNVKQDSKSNNTVQTSTTVSKEETKNENKQIKDISQEQDLPVDEEFLKDILKNNKKPSIKDNIDLLKQEISQIKQQDKSRNIKNLLGQLKELLPPQSKTALNKLAELEKRVETNVPVDDDEIRELLNENAETINTDDDNIRDSAKMERFNETLKSFTNKYLSRTSNNDKTIKGQTAETKEENFGDDRIQKIKQEIQQEIEAITDKINSLKTRQLDLEKQLSGENKFSAVKRVLMEELSSIKNEINSLKTKLVVEREVKEISSKEFDEMEQEIDKEIGSLEKETTQLKDLIKKEPVLDLKSMKEQITNLKNGEKIIQKIEKEIDLDNLLEEINGGNKEDLSQADIKKLLQLDPKKLNNNDLKNLMKIINKTIDNSEEMAQASSVSSLDQGITRELNVKAKLINQLVDLLNQVKSKKIVQETIVQERARLTVDVSNEQQIIIQEKDIKEKKLDEYVDHILDEFKQLKDEESMAKFILNMRHLYLTKEAPFKNIIKLLMQKGKMDPELLKEEFGIVVGEKTDIVLGEIKPETREVLKKLLNIDASAMANNEQLHRLLDKGRMDRRQFEKFYGKKVTKSGWDYGVLTFNETNLGILKERAEINSILKFWKLMEKFSTNGEEENIRETAELFLSKNEYTEIEKGLISLFLIEYEDSLIDPDYHLFDIYNKYLKEKTFKNLNDAEREELVIAVLIRLIKNIDVDKNEKMTYYNRLMSFCEMDESSKEFERSVHILEFYFSNGGKMKKSFFDVGKELQFFEENTDWTEAHEKEVAQYTVSELVKGMSKPIKESPRIKLRSLSERLKGKLKK
ncbi:MAG: hypothetical protein PHV30_00140 [Candidatus Margulisbacteria bacterium]|nr:hypothetical protein [Candidatus Margulisiibacteriota bacterium]